MGYVNLYKIDDNKQLEFTQLLQDKYEFIGEQEYKSLHDKDRKYIIGTYLYRANDSKIPDWQWILDEYKCDKVKIYSSPRAILKIESDGIIYVISYGLAYFSVDKYCDVEFAFEFAKRIAFNEIKTTTLTAPNSRKNKIVNVFVDYSNLSYESGESYAKIKARMDTGKEKRLFKETIEIGHSIKAQLIQNNIDSIIEFIEYIEVTLKKPIINKIPVFGKVKDDELIADLDERLLKKINDNIDCINISELDVIGVTEIFNNNDSSFVLKYKRDYENIESLTKDAIDPCMGSGHILVYAFDVFMQIYENAGWSQRDAAQSIIQNNIYGLDIDDRAAQLSYFAVLMKARQYDRRILTRGIEPNVYAVQESNGINRGQLKYFGTGLTDTEKNVAVSQMDGLLNTLNDAKEYGSLLNVEDYDWELLEKFVENTHTESQISFDTFGLDETAEQLKQLIRIGRVMAQRYEIVATNPPYAGTSNLSAKVNDFVKKNYPDSKADLFAVFIEHCSEMLKKNGYQAMITQHSWMFLSSYEKLREKLQQLTIINMAHLGARAFEEIGGEVVQTTSFVLKKNYEMNYMGTYCRLVEPITQQGKEAMYLSRKKRYIANQNSFTKIPGKPVAYWISKNMLKVFENIYISDLAISNGQNITGNNNIYIRLFWEVELNKINSNYWAKCARGGGYRRYYGMLIFGRISIVLRSSRNLELIITMLRQLILV